MRKVCWMLAGLAFLCATASARADKGFELDKKRRVAEPISYKNLTLMPVVARVKPPNKQYLILDEGMKQGKVKIIEKGEGEVNQLVLQNSSDQPLFVMAGEVIIGGKQDRIIGKDTIVPARSKEAVPVFCVEHGRWSGRKASFETTGAMAHTNLRNQAKYADQSAVWSEVSAKNSAQGLENATDTYRDVAQGAKVEKAVADYQKYFAEALAKSPAKAEMVGFIVLINGEVVAIETFSSPTLFAKLSDKLLRSYYVEAVDQPVAKAPKKAGAAEVKAFAKQAKEAKKKVVHEGKAAATYQFDSAEMKGTTVKEPAAAADEEAVYDGAFK